MLTDRDKYNCGVPNVISDPNKFHILNIGPDKYLNYVINVQKRFRKIFKNLLDTKETNDREYDNICPFGSRPRILYGLPNIHKPILNGMLKFRSILSAINTPGYKLAKYLILNLKPLTHNNYTIHDSFAVAKEVTSFDSSLLIASLESLFTNIPLEETINDCTEDLFSKQLYTGTLTKLSLKKLPITPPSESSFIYYKSLFKQIDVVAMDSPLGLTLANVFLCHFENKWLKLVVYICYVDDIFVLFKSKDHLPLFHII